MNRQWTMASRPAGMPTEENFKFVSSAVPSPKDGEMLVKTIYLSVDPYMRARMRNVRSYVRPFEIGDVIEGGVVGRVVESKNPKFKAGDYVLERLGWQDYAVTDGKNTRRLDGDPKYLSAALGVLGMPGLSAYFALLEVGKPKAGETVLVSSAAGAVGSAVGQIAKIKGGRAVGIAGSDQKVKYLMEECGFDAALNYKSSQNLRRSIRNACPNGVDVYFDNVGGDISDAAITLINYKARIIICGQISIYNREKTEMGPRNLSYLLVNRARMEGFLIHDYESRFDEGLAQLSEWLKSGRLTYRETIVNGLENAPRAFIGLFHGENIGKQLVKVSDPI